MPNENCLEGIRCPDCGNEDRFLIAGTTVFTVTDDGTGDHGDIEWDADSYARCPDCDREGTLKDFGYGGVEVEPTPHRPSPGDWEMVRHGPGSDYGPNAYTLWPQGIILKGDVSEADAALIEAAPRLRAALEKVVVYAENEADALEKLKDSPEAEAEAERAWQAVEAARALLAATAPAAAAQGRPPAPAPVPSVAEILADPKPYLPPEPAGDHGPEHGPGNGRKR